LQAFLTIEPWFRQPGYLLVAWTLSFEIGFYLLAALCLGLALRTGRPWIGYALAAVFFAAGLIPAIGSWLPLLTLWPHFAVGGLVWLLSRQLPRIAVRLAWGTVLLALIAACAWFLPVAAGFTLVFVTACAWTLLMLQPFDARLAATPALRWLGWIGTFSYSLYLIHAPVVGKFRNALSRHWQPGDPGALWVPLAACVLAIASAWCFYRLVELRTEGWRRNFMHDRASP
jgi:peptidoglycan/LPS O-acetylase OafA/YrhL